MINMERKQLVVFNDGERVAYKTEDFLLSVCYVSNNGCNIHNTSEIAIIVNVIRNKLKIFQYLLAILLYLPYLSVIQ